MGCRTALIQPYTLQPFACTFWFISFFAEVLCDTKKESSTLIHSSRAPVALVLFTHARAHNDTHSTHMHPHH